MPGQISLEAGGIFSQPEFPREIFLSPLGPQGPRIGIQINSQDDLEKLRQVREGLGRLPELERTKTGTILSALREMGLPIIDL